MKYFYLAILVPFLFSCTDEKQPFQGKVEDFISGEMSFERDIESGFLSFQHSLQLNGKEVVYTKWNGIFQFFDSSTGRIISKKVVPEEGPMAMKGGPEIGKFFDENTLLVTNSTGQTNLYKEDSLQVSFIRDLQAYEPKGYLYFPDNRNALHRKSAGVYELTFNPFDFMAFRQDKDGLDLGFGSWIGAFDEEGNWMCKSDFKAPYDESYSQSSKGGHLVRMVEDGKSWAMFAYSDSLYQIDNCKVVQKVKLESLTPINYFPEKYEGTKNSGAWVKPEDGAINRYLLQDKRTGLTIRWLQLKEKRGDLEVKDPRQRMFSNEATYLMLVYDSEWQLLAELEMLYPKETRFENLFSTSEGLFINKPEQKSEDEYEFYKIDLSKFSDK